MKDFIDKDRRTSMEYYDIQDSITEDNIPEVVTKLKNLINKDPYYLDPYLLLADLYEDTGKKAESEKIIGDAYEKALELVTKKSGKWPKKLEWGWLENRHIIRTFFNMGILYWKNKKTIEAYSLFKKLLDTNPNDNPGVRYFMVAILENMTENEFNRRFDKGGYWDNEIDDWFDKKIINHQKEFSQWLKLFR
jgi:tetratricopeptide (TPR) repeat protein